MAVFPTLEPAEREYTFGNFSISKTPAANAGAIRFLHTNTANEYGLRLVFKYLSDRQANDLRFHYILNSGGFLSFELPATIWKGHSFSGNIVPVSTKWIYTSPPQEQHVDLGRVNVTVDLLSVATTDDINPLGVVQASITGGAVSAGTARPGAALTVTASMSAGAATGS